MDLSGSCSNSKPESPTTLPASLVACPTKLMGADSKAWAEFFLMSLIGSVQFPIELDPVMKRCGCCLSSLVDVVGW